MKPISPEQRGEHHVIHRAAVAGCNAAWETLFVRYQPIVQHEIRTKLSRSTGDLSAVDDACQDVWIVVWQKLPLFDCARPLGPWLRGIAQNVARTWLRSTVRYRQHVRELDPATLSAVPRNDTINQPDVDEILAEYSLTTRRIVELMLKHSCDVTAVANESGFPPRKLQRLLKPLREKISVRRAVASGQ